MRILWNEAPRRLPHSTSHFSASYQPDLCESGVGIALDSSLKHRRSIPNLDDANFIIRKFDVQGKSPHMVLFGPDEKRAYVSNTNSATLASIKISTGM